MKKSVLICYQYFYPGYKAGGPVQSLMNMIEALGNEYSFSVFTSVFDLNEKHPYKNITTDEWNDISINGVSIKVWYASLKVKSSVFIQIVKGVNPQYIFINGMYGSDFFLTPLLNMKKLKAMGTQLIISPRGMLQQGALAVKPFKKKLYYAFLKSLSLSNTVKWHATNEEESNDIKKMFGQNSKVSIAANIPKKPANIFLEHVKIKNKLSLAYLSIITPKKNLLLLLQILRKCPHNIALDIYGPIKENDYWLLCEKEIKLMPANTSVVYKGDVLPHNVQATFAKYDTSVLLTQGENFGHALFESLSIGRPVITSNFTNWNKLNQASAGWNVDITDTSSIINLLVSLVDKDADEWQQFTNGAFNYATQYFNQQNFQQQYQQLFS